MVERLTAERDTGQVFRRDRDLREETAVGIVLADRPAPQTAFHKQPSLSTIEPSGESAVLLQPNELAHVSHVRGLCVVVALADPRMRRIAEVHGPAIRAEANAVGDRHTAQIEAAKAMPGRVPDKSFPPARRAVLSSCRTRSSPRGPSCRR